MENQIATCRPSASSGVLVSILVILLHSYLSHGLELPDYQTLSFSNPNQNLEFTRLAVHNQTGSIYIGGGDRLYRLSADFERQETVDTAVSCGEDSCPLNYNKILLVDNRCSMLVTCGSESIGANSGAKGTCQIRSLNSIATPLRDDHDDDSAVVASGKQSRGCYCPGPENGGVDTLYVAANDRIRYVTPLSRRSYAASLTSDTIFNTERDAEILVDIWRYSVTPLINYVYGFVNEHKASATNYTYFVTTQEPDYTTTREDNIFVSRINRVCQNSDFRSYAEITLECQGASPTNKYNLVQAAYVGPAGSDLAASLGLNAGDDVMYGVFAKNEGEDGNIPSNQSALCVFKLEDIEKKFIDGIHKCLRKGGDYGLDYLLGTTCLGNNEVTRKQATAQQCTATNWANADEFNPLESTAVIEWSDIIPSSIITTTHRNHTIAFVGTTDGQLVKTHIVKADEGREYEQFSLSSPSSPAGQVLRDAHLDGDQEHVTLLTEQKVIKLNVSNCDAYKTCDECVLLNGDPYCGWCVQKNRCTRFDECGMGDEGWSPHQCIEPTPEPEPTTLASDSPAANVLKPIGIIVGITLGIAVFIS
ncbi:LOW QUALITY PROTEIN: plexin-A4-like [Amphiura filiformis]|uniref:LOW QUALITY PROTEIN: plexin-A4-like n=1 Tax=Amphiura filiformis TaxID=82378 RepID=UPI003B21D5F3